MKWLPTLVVIILVGCQPQPGPAPAPSKEDQAEFARTMKALPKEERAKYFQANGQKLPGGILPPGKQSN